MTSAAEQAAALALEIFHNLPRKYKPRDLPSGAREWTPLSAIILSKVDGSSSEHNFKVVSLATGTKSLPVLALPKCHGRVLHDCHAEILAIRGFNYWLLRETKWMVQNPDHDSEWLRFTDGISINDDEDAREGAVSPSRNHPIALRSDVRISLFSTTAPCGDASMDILVRSSSDAHPWPEENIVPGSLPLGRGHFSLLGHLRRKPARADAEVSMSKSCTDKLMLSQFLGLLRFPLYMLMDGRECKLTRLIVYEEEYDEVGYERAFGPKGRLSDIMCQPGVIADEKMARFFDFDVLPSDFRKFEYAKLSTTLGQTAPSPSKVCNFSLLWIAGSSFADASAGMNGDNSNVVLEQIINGVKQGFKQWDFRPAKSSSVSREKMVQKAVGLVELSQQQQHQRDTPGSSRLSTLALQGGDTNWVDYKQLKTEQLWRGRKQMKQGILRALGGWPDKMFDDNFKIHVQGCLSLPPLLVSLSPHPRACGPSLNALDVHDLE